MNSPSAAIIVCTWLMAISFAGTSVSTEHADDEFVVSWSNSIIDRHQGVRSIHVLQGACGNTIMNNPGDPPRRVHIQDDNLPMCCNTYVNNHFATTNDATRQCIKPASR
jgi:hypothetical protein